MLISTLLLLSPAALAQEAASGGEPPALNAQLFRPSVDGRQTFWLNDADVNESGTFTSRFLLQWVDQPLSYRDADGNEVAVVDDVFQLDLLGGLALGPVRVGLDLPVYLRSTGQAGGETGLGDVALDLKGAILEDGRAPLGLALGARLGFPTATVDGSLGTEGLAADLGLYVHKDVGEATFLANLGTRAQPEAVLENVTIDDQLFFGLGMGISATDTLDLSAELAGHRSYGVTDAPVAHPMEILPGASLRPGGGDLVLRTAVGLPLGNGIGAPQTRVLLAVAIEPPAERDRDGDGLLDEVDQCPEVPEDLDAWRDDDGCPEPTEVTVRLVDTDGIPVPTASLSVDGTAAGEGVIFLEAGPASLSASAPGFEPMTATIEVPTGAPTTVTLTMDLLPSRLVVRTVGPDGAPVAARIQVGDVIRDSDGVLTLEREAGRARVDVVAEGYLSRRLPTELKPGATTELVVELERALAEVTKERIEIKDSIYFETAKAVIKPESFELLDQVATILADYPEITLLRIEGHTDSRGRDSYNLELSKKRAASVRQYLVDKGISPERLESEGYGETRPLDPANNEAAWAKNRRVDFFIAARDDEE